MGENKRIVKMEGTGLGQRGCIPGSAEDLGKSLLVSITPLSFVELIIISLQQRVGAVAGPMKTVDPICEDK